MAAKRWGLAGLLFVIVFAVLAPATTALATTGCNNTTAAVSAFASEGSSTSNCVFINGAQGGSVSTSFDNTTVTVTFPPNPAAGNFTYDVTALDLSICGGKLCRGAGADLGTLPAHYGEDHPIVITLKYDPSISPRPGHRLPVYKQTGQFTRRIAPCLRNEGDTPCVASERWDNTGSLSIKVRLESDDPRIGAGP